MIRALGGDLAAGAAAAWACWATGDGYLRETWTNAGDGQRRRPIMPAPMANWNAQINPLDHDYNGPAQPATARWYTANARVSFIECDLRR